MKQYAVQDLSPNTYLDAPAFLDDGYILLAPDTPISEALLRRLADWEFSQVLSEGRPTSTSASDQSAGPAATATLNKNLKEQETANQVIAAYRQRVVAVAGLFERYKAKNELSINEITELVKGLMSLVKSQPRYALNLPDIESPGLAFLPSHAVKSSILSVALADVLKLPPHRTIEVGIAGLLHTIGMMRIPPEIYLSERSLDPREKQMIIAHPILGFRALKDAGFPMQIPVAVLEHHERMDGSGYPRKLTGDRLSLYGKIVGVASSYVAAISERPFRQARDGHSGIMDLLRDAGKIYDEAVLRALVFTLSIYPIGTYVELSNGSVGVVVRTNPSSPKLPVVRLLSTADGDPYPDQSAVQIEDGGELSIVRPLSPEEARPHKAARPG